MNVCCPLSQPNSRLKHFSSRKLLKKKYTKDVGGILLYQMFIIFCWNVNNTIWHVFLSNHTLREKRKTNIWNYNKTLQESILQLGKTNQNCCKRRTQKTLTLFKFKWKLVYNVIFHYETVAFACLNQRWNSSKHQRTCFWGHVNDYLFALQFCTVQYFLMMFVAKLYLAKCSFWTPNIVYVYQIWEQLRYWLMNRKWQLINP